MAFKFVLLDLPNETLSTILEHLNPDALAAIVLVCSRLQGVAERLLYTNIAITERVDSDPETIVIPRQTEGCCSAVRRRPHLSSSIKKVSIRWIRDRARNRQEFRLAPGVLQSLRYLLYSAPFIESLELHLAGFQGGYEELLGGCMFSLRYLALSGPVNAPLEWFLCTQPGIVQLHLGDQHLPLQLSSEDLPLLEIFRGDARTAASILPGRPVHGLGLNGYEPSQESLISFAYTKCPIRILDMSGLSITPNQLLTVSKYLTALETLRMRLALRHTLHFTFSGMMLLSALTQVLGAFQNLSSLDLSPTSVDGIRTVHNEAEEFSLCNVWAGVCPSLRRVKFPSHTDWVLPPDDVWVILQR